MSRALARTFRIEGLFDEGLYTRSCEHLSNGGIVDQDVSAAGTA